MLYEYIALRKSDWGKIPANTQDAIKNANKQPGDKYVRIGMGELRPEHTDVRWFPGWALKGKYGRYHIGGCSNSKAAKYQRKLLEVRP